MLLNDIWVDDEVVAVIQEAFNSDVACEPSINPMEELEARCINNIIKQFTHTLRYLPLKFYDEDMDYAKQLFFDVLTHNIVPLVIETRTKLKSIKLDEFGKLHRKVNFQPYNNTGDDANTTLQDKQMYSELEIASSLLYYLRKSCWVLKDIYKELKTMVQIVFEGE